MRPVLRTLALLTRSSLLALAIVVALIQPAAADPAGPTDYSSEILWIEPDVGGFALSIIGGDSFLQLEVEPGTEVVVVGYRGEQYLRVSVDGVVEENQNSPTKYLNEERYGSELPPAFATPDAEATWSVVDTDGSWAWHDHRTHLMATQPPPGSEPGDQVNEGVVILLVDGVEVKIAVATYWVDPPSRVAPAFGLLLGIALVMVSTRQNEPRTGIVLGLLLVAGAALGAWQNLSLPAETGPAFTNWSLPLQGLLSLGAASWQGRQATNRLGHQIADVLQIVAALHLLVWGLLRRQTILAAILPTAAPASIERVVTTMALVVGAGLSMRLIGSVVRDTKSED